MLPGPCDPAITGPASSARVRGFRGLRAQGAGGRRVDRLAPVVPADPVARVWRLPQDLLDHTAARRPVGRLGLADNSLTHLEDHDRLLPLASRRDHTAPA